MKIDRLIGIITILFQNDKITAPDLAKRFEVSRRTINRDIEDICKAGIPLVTIQGYGGGISIADGYKIDKTVLTDEELQAIFAGLKSIDNVSKTSHRKRLLDKLYPKSKSPVAVNEIILIDLASHYQDELTQKIEVIKQAIINQEVLSFQYYYSKGETARSIEPYLLVFKWSSWYVYGYCLQQNDFRLFKLNRLWDLQLTTHHFDLREISQDILNFDNYFSFEPIHLTAIFKECVKHRLIEEYGVNCFVPKENGKLLFTRDFVNYENLRSWIMSFGDKVQVIKPQELIDDIQEQARNISSMYEKHDI